MISRLWNAFDGLVPMRGGERRRRPFHPRRRVASDRIIPASVGFQSRDMRRTLRNGRALPACRAHGAVLRAIGDGDPEGAGK